MTERYNALDFKSTSHSDGNECLRMIQNLKCTWLYIRLSCWYEAIKHDILF